MKTLFQLFFFALAFTIAACNVAKQSSSNNDDVYYSTKDKPQQVYTLPIADNKQQPQTLVQQPSAQKEVNQKVDAEYAKSTKKNAYDSDDYYDYTYASRLRRFHNSNNAGLGYYDNFYTNTYYYDYNPTTWGTSIYSSYGFYSPSYTTIIWNRPFGYGFGYNGYYNYGYNPYHGWNNGWNDPYYNPYYSNNNPWAWSSPYYGCYNSPWYWNSGWGYYGGNSYNNGYHNGYNNGFHNGYNQAVSNVYNNNSNGNYYNSYDNTTHVSGPRNSVSTSGREVGRRGIAEKYESAISVGSDNAPSIRNNTFTDVKNLNNSNLNDVRNGDVKFQSRDLNKPEIKNPILTNPRIPGIEDNVTKPRGNFDNPIRNNNYNSNTRGIDEAPLNRDNGAIRQNNFNNEFDRSRNFNNNNTQRNFDSPKQTQQPTMQEQPRQYQQPINQEQPRRYEQQRQVEQPRILEQPRQYQQPSNKEQPLRFEQQRQIEQPRIQEKPKQYETPKMETPRIESPRSNNPSQNYSVPRGGGRRQ